MSFIHVIVSSESEFPWQRLSKNSKIPNCKHFELVQNTKCICLIEVELELSEEFRRLMFSRVSSRSALNLSFATLSYLSFADSQILSRALMSCLKRGFSSVLFEFCSLSFSSSSAHELHTYIHTYIHIYIHTYIHTTNK